MHYSAVILLAALIAAACAQQGVIVSSIYSASSCDESSMIGMVSDYGSVENCVGILCEQIGTSGQFKTVACLSEPGTPPASWVRYNAYSENTCTTASNLTAMIPNTCVLIRTDTALKVTTCSNGKYTMVQAGTLADCVSNKGTSQDINPADCTDGGDGKNWLKGFCEASAAPGTANTPAKGPAKANTAVQSVQSVVALALGLAWAL